MSKEWEIRPILCKVGCRQDRRKNEHLMLAKEEKFGKKSKKGKIGLLMTCSQSARKGKRPRDLKLLGNMTGRIASGGWTGGGGISNLNREETKRQSSVLDRRLHGGKILRVGGGQEGNEKGRRSVEKTESKDP